MALSVLRGMWVSVLFFMAIYQFSHLLKKTFRTEMLGWTSQNPMYTNASAQGIFFAFAKKIGGGGG